MPVATGTINAAAYANADGSAGGMSTGSFTDRSGTITTGGTSQQVAAANTSRSYLLIQNNSSGDLWVNFGVAAVANQPSVKLAPGAALELGAAPGFISTEAVNIIGATTGQVFTAKEA